MRYAFTGSALLHLTALGAGLLMFTWPEPDDAPAEQSVSVAVISVAAVSSNEVNTVESDASVTQRSSGAEAVPEAVPETVEATEPETLEPVTEPVQEIEPPPEIEKAEPEQAQPNPAYAPPEEVEPVAIAPLSAAASEPLPAETAPPVTAETVIDPAEPVAQTVIEPTEAADPNAPPIPQTLTIARTAKPTYPKPEPAPKKPTPQPKKPEPVRVAEVKPPVPAGNGGQNDNDAAAGKPTAGQKGNNGGAGDAEVARWQSQVKKKVQRALRMAGGKGEVLVQFVVTASGQAQGVNIIVSSGNPKVDQAAIKTVSRAAPFPPMPVGMPNTWTFNIPLQFKG